MNKEQLVEEINKLGFSDSIIEQLNDEAKKNNLIFVFGASDDLMEFRGAICDEVGVYDGGFAFINNGCIISSDEIEEIENYSSKAISDVFPKAKVIEALWCKNEFTWSYKTDIPHLTFDIIKYNEKYCRGIVFSLNDLV